MEPLAKSEAPYLLALCSLLAKIGSVLSVGTLVLAAIGASASLASLGLGFAVLAAIAAHHVRTRQPNPIVVAAVAFGTFIPISFLVPATLAVAVLLSLISLGGTTSLIAVARHQVRYSWLITAAMVIAYFGVVRSLDRDSILGAAIVGAAILGTAHLHREIAATARTNDQRYEELFSSAADAILVTDSIGSVVLANNEAIELFGYTEDKLIGTSIEELMPPEFRPGHEALLSGFAQSTDRRRAKADRPQITGLHKNGRKIPIEITISKNAARASAGFTAIVRDVTDATERRMQQELATACMSEIGLAPNVDAALAAILRLVCELTGWVGGEAWIPNPDDTELESAGVFRSDSHILGPRKGSEDRRVSPGQGSIGHAWASKEPVAFADLADSDIFSNIGKAKKFGFTNGLAVPATSGEDVVAVLVFQLQENIEAHPQIIQTISTVASQLATTIQRKQAEDALKASEARNRSMLKAIPDLILRVASDGTYLDFQVPEHAQHFPPADRFIGQTVGAVAGPDFAKNLRIGHLRAIETGEAQIWEYQYEMDGGEVRDREARVLSIPELDEALVLVRDTTTQKKAERRLQDAIRSKDELIASVSHEIRTPLTAVIGFAELLEPSPDTLSSSERQEMISSIAREASDIAYIVEDLLVAARAEIDTLNVTEQPVDLEAQLDHVLNRWHESHNHPMARYADPVTAIGDPGRIRQILRNLVTNAARYGGEHKEVRISALDGRAFVEIRDDGSGVPFDHRASIFDPYERAPAALGQPGSVGLGLTISRTLAQLMNGDLTYERTAGWSTFRLSLPNGS